MIVCVALDPALDITYRLELSIEVGDADEIDAMDARTAVEEV